MNLPAIGSYWSAKDDRDRLFVVKSLATRRSRAPQLDGKTDVVFARFGEHDLYVSTLENWRKSKVPVGDGQSMREK